jgi:agmatine/peptidylarginine deiminase
MTHPTPGTERSSTNTRLPAEWEPQTAVMLTWPHADTDWAEQLEIVEPLYTRLAAMIAARQQVLIVCRDDALRARIGACLALAGVATDAVIYGMAPSNDTWARDHGPLTVVDAHGEARLVDFRFNGWGGKYPAELDDQITSTLHATGRFGNTVLDRSPLVLEGGALDTDGCGTLLVVRRTLIDPARNPGWRRAEIEAELRARLGATRLLWLEQGQLSGDDTDGHIDTLARFCDTETICYVASSNPSHPDHAELDAMQRELQALRRIDGQPYRLIPLPLPRRMTDSQGNPLPATYANFLIINGAVLAPVYDDPADHIALERLSAAFPGREIVAIDCRPLIHQGGSLHCITMQLPVALTLSTV